MQKDEIIIIDGNKYIKYAIRHPRTNSGTMKVFDHFHRLPVGTILTRKRITEVSGLSNSGGLACRFNHPEWGRGTWMRWLERVGHGKYRLRQKPLISDYSINTLNKPY